MNNSGYRNMNDLLKFIGLKPFWLKMILSYLRHQWRS